MPFSTLDRHRATPLVGQKMFQRPKQKRTKAALFFADGSKAFVLQQICKKSLGEVFSFSLANTLSLDKTINGWPINAAEFFQCLLCRRRFTLRFYYDAPMRASKLGRAPLCAEVSRQLQSTRESSVAAATRIRPVVSFRSGEEGSCCDSSKNLLRNQACKWLAEKGTVRRPDSADFIFRRMSGS